MRISDWSSDVCSSDLGAAALAPTARILLPWTTTSPGETSAPLRPSNRCAALSTAVVGAGAGAAAGVCAWVETLSRQAVAKPARRYLLPLLPRAGDRPECTPIFRLSKHGNTPCVEK